MDEKDKHTCKRKRHYKKIAAAFGSAVVMAAAAIPGVANLITPPAVKPPPEPVPVKEEAPLQPVPPATDMPQLSQVSKEEAQAKKVLHVKATAYAPGPHDNDQWGDKTYVGTKVRPGIIAVDPRIIPLGSQVMIKYPDGSKEYAIAEDTGGAIKGHRIDVAKWTVKEAYKFGIKPVKVYILHTPANEEDDQA